MCVRRSALSGACIKTPLITVYGKGSKPSIQLKLNGDILFWAGSKSRQPTASCKERASAKAPRRKLKQLVLLPVEVNVRWIWKQLRSAQVSKACQAPLATATEGLSSNSRNRFGELFAVGSANPWTLLELTYEMGMWQQCNCKASGSIVGPRWTQLITPRDHLNTSRAYAARNNLVPCTWQSSPTYPRLILYRLQLLRSTAACLKYGFIELQSLLLLTTLRLIRQERDAHTCA